MSEVPLYGVHVLLQQHSRSIPISLIVATLRRPGERKPQPLHPTFTTHLKISTHIQKPPPPSQKSALHGKPAHATSIMRNSAPRGPYSTNMPRALWRP